MTGENISDALNMLGDDIIEETDRLRSDSAKAAPRQRRVIRWSVLAACVCLLAAGAFAWNFAANRQEVAVEGSIIAFFIYQGNEYRFYSYADNADIVGEKLGTAKGGIGSESSEWEYTELAGSIKGDFYGVKGYDPSIMLCMKNEWIEENNVMLFIRSTEWTFKYGSELFEDRLHISENYSALRYKDSVSWNYGLNQKFRLEGNDKLIEKFIAELDSAEFFPRENLPFEEKYGNMFDTKLYHLYLEMKNGVSVNFHFLRGDMLSLRACPTFA